MLPETLDTVLLLDLRMTRDRTKKPKTSDLEDDKKFSTHHSPPAKLVSRGTGRRSVINEGTMNSRRVIITSRTPRFNQKYRKVPLLNRATTHTKYLKTTTLGTAEQRQVIATAPWSLDAAMFSIFRSFFEDMF